MKKLILLLITISTFISLQASTLNLSMNSSPSKLNPILPADSASSAVSGWLFDGLMQYDKNEIFGAKLAKAILPNFGYSDVQIAEIEKIILATQQ